jgi:colanic acid/amylovoran biosynthesis glycosyltransferase
LTTTFIEREIRGLRERGVPVVLCSNRRSDRATLSASSRDLLDEVVSVFPLSPARIGRSHLRTLVTQPRRYASALTTVLVGEAMPLHERWRSLRLFAGAIVLADEIRDRGVRHVHAHFPGNPALLAMVIAAVLGVPYSVTVHGVPRDDPPLLRRKLDGAAFVAVISEDARQRLRERLGDALADRLHLVRCGVDTSAFTPGADHGGSTPLVVSVGQLLPKKGHDVLIEASRRLRDRGRAFRLVIVGDGPDRPSLRCAVADARLDGTVELLGAQSQERVLELLRRADVFTLACRHAADGTVDGVPVAIIEAMACALPVVSTRVAGIPELVVDGETGMLVPPDDPAALADALDALLAEPARGRALGARARGRVVQGWSLDRQVERMFELLGAAPPARTAP